MDKPPECFDARQTRLKGILPSQESSKRGLGLNVTAVTVEILITGASAADFR
jgi:hypothetical protein